MKTTTSAGRSWMPVATPEFWHASVAVQFTVVVPTGKLVPAGVRTSLMGQQNNEDSMPLEDFLTETMELLAAEPDAKEIVVERARFIRDAQANGNYDDVLAMFTSVEGGR